MVSRRKIKDPEVGSIVELPLPDGRLGYARALKFPLMAFYALSAESTPQPSEILGQPIAFKVWIMASAVSSGRWRVVGWAPLEPELAIAPWFFKQDIISKRLSLYQAGTERPATREQCAGLERAAVWSAHHAESRLDDHLHGRPNKWHDAMKLEA
jgi:hypothetical protein